MKMIILKMSEKIAAHFDITGSRKPRKEKLGQGIISPEEERDEWLNFYSG